MVDDDDQRAPRVKQRPDKRAGPSAGVPRLPLPVWDDGGGVATTTGCPTTTNSSVRPFSHEQLCLAWRAA